MVPANADSDSFVPHSVVSRHRIVRFGDNLPVFGVLQREFGVARDAAVASRDELLLLRRDRIGLCVPHVLPREVLPNARRRDVSREKRGLSDYAFVRRKFAHGRGAVRERAVSGFELDVHDGVRVGEEE